MKKQLDNVETKMEILRQKQAISTKNVTPHYGPIQEILYKKLRLMHYNFNILTATNISHLHLT
jgi:hypothetical protein